MSCYKPNLMQCRHDKLTGSLAYSFLGPANYEDPRSFGSYFDLESKDKFNFIVPCGHCVGCRMDYIRDWTHRMVYELIANNYQAIFVTLTYDNSHLPMCIDGPTLSKRDCQLFIKRLRKAFPDRKIRYYIAGEYGPITHRPHYHAIIYGLSLSDFSDLRKVGQNELKQPYYSSLKFASIWQNGFVQMSEVNYSTCSYVARYVTKKAYGLDLQEFAERQPEFNLSSRCPGIGFSMAPEVILSGDSYDYLALTDGQHTLSVPRSFYRHLKRNLEDLPADQRDYFLKKCYERSSDSNSRLVSNVAFFGLPFKDYLAKNCSKLVSNLRLLPQRK